MELNALTRFNSVATDLFKMGSPRRMSLVKLSDHFFPDANREKAPRPNDLLRCIILSFVKGFIAGFSTQTILKLIPILIKYGLKPSKLLSTLKKMSWTDQLKFGAFCGAYWSLLNTTMMATRHLGRTGLARYRGLISGSIAGSALVCAPKGTQSTIALFFFVRALELLGRHGAKKRMLPTMNHGDVLMMAIASAQVLWAWIHMPNCMDRGYWRFLNHHGGRPESIYRAIECIDANQPISPKIMENLDIYRQRRGVQFAFDHNHKEMFCQILHPEETCTHYFVRFWLKSFRRSVPVYLPVYLVPLLLFNFKNVRKKPVQMTVATMKGVFRSSMFLSAYCSVAWVVECFLQQVIGCRSHANVFASGLGAGSCVIIEKKSRRIELALYVLTQAIRSWWLCAKQIFPRVVKPLPLGETILFMGSSAYFLHCFLNHPELVRPTYFRGISWLTKHAETPIIPIQVSQSNPNVPLDKDSKKLA